jgi:hypothetical protein
MSFIYHHRGITWRTKEGIQTPNYFGSITQSSTVRLGEDDNGEDIFVPLNGILPMVRYPFSIFPTDGRIPRPIGGWFREQFGCDVCWPPRPLQTALLGFLLPLYSVYVL